MARKKKIIPGVDLIGFGHKGWCIGKSSTGEIVLVQGGVPGDTIDLIYTRKKKGLKSGRIHSVTDYSLDRTTPLCQHFEHCGGCNWQHLEYNAQLAHKQAVVSNAIYRIAKLDPDEFLPILGANPIYHYRNKMQYSFSARQWITRDEIESGRTIENLPSLGLHPAGVFGKVVNLDSCKLLDKEDDLIRNTLRNLAIKEGIPFFDYREHSGFMRQLTIKRNRRGDRMVNLIVAKNDKKQAESFMNLCVEKLDFVNSWFYTINTKKNDATFDLLPVHFYGDKYIEEELLGIRFRIGAKSFFQTNPYQAEQLYRLALEFADIQKHDRVLDLYCGVGSIGLCAAPHAASVVGIETIGEAVEIARENAVINRIDNARFYTGDVRMLLDPKFIEKEGPFDLIITDPPRDGMHPDVVRTLLEARAPKIVYVSCNPSTQARDLALLSDHYHLKKIQAVDMFPHTNHVESVALLIKK